MIKGFADARSAAMGMGDRFGCGHGVIVTDRRGVMLEMLMFTGDKHTAEDAISAGVELPAHYPTARRVVLVSLLDDVDLQVPNELDMEMWRSAVDRCASAGLELWEWILLSKDLIRSLAMTADTWADERRLTR
jgi:hypothetical protein